MRSSSAKKMNSTRLILGVILGFLSGSLCFYLNTEPSIFYTMSLLGAAIGGMIPVILAFIKKSDQAADGDAEEAV